jgi:hypothetical protein
MRHDQLADLFYLVYKVLYENGDLLRLPHAANTRVDDGHQHIQHRNVPTIIINKLLRIVSSTKL